MALDPQLRAPAHQLFIQEAVELFQQVESDLHGLLQETNPQQLQPVIQALHIIHSGAVQLELNSFHPFICQLEALCRTLQQHPRLRKAHLSLLSQISHTLKLSLLAYVQSGSPTGEVDCSAAQILLTQLEQRLAPTETTTWEAADPPISEAQLIALALTTEVEQVLQQLEAISSSPEMQADELKPHLEQLRDLGEISDFSELVAISQTALASLAVSPQSAATISQIALAGYIKVYEQMRTAASASGPMAEQPSSPLPPGSLSTTDAFVWQTGATIFVLPSRNMIKILSPARDQMNEMGTWLNWRTQQVPVYALTPFILDPQPQLSLTERSLDLQQRPTLLLIEHSNQTLALQVEIDHLITTSQLDLQSVQGMASSSYYLGPTLLKAGQSCDVVDLDLFLSQHFAAHLGRQVN